MLRLLLNILCRSFLAPWYDDNGDEVYYGRNNLGVVSLNLVRCGIEANGDIETFWNILDKKLELCKKALMSRIKRLENVTASVAPILYCSGAMGVKLKQDDKIIDLMKKGRASISLGYIGVHETIYALFGDDVINGHEEFAVSIVKHLREKVDKWKDETGYGFSCYSSPGENLCYRFNKLDVEKFGEIENVTTKGYYTNSFHRLVEDNMNVFDKAVFESPYPQYASGGFISYGEYPSMVGKEEALMKVWKEVSKYQPYYGTNTTSDKCISCGYEGEFLTTDEGFECPSCGNNDEETISVIRRVTGYLGSTGSRPVNKGKHKEMQTRVKHV